MVEIEKTIKLVADQNATGFFDDDLSKVINGYGAVADELDLLDLELISAAGYQDYSKFKELVKREEEKAGK